MRASSPFSSPLEKVSTPFSILEQGPARILEGGFKPLLVSFDCCNIIIFFIRFQPLEAITCGFLLLVCEKQGVLLIFDLFSSLLNPEAIFLWLSPCCV